MAIEIRKRISKNPDLTAARLKILDAWATMARLSSPTQEELIDQLYQDGLICELWGASDTYATPEQNQREKMLLPFSYHPTLSYASLSYKPLQKLVTTPERKQIRLTNSQNTIFSLLMQHPTQIITKGLIHDHLHPDYPLDHVSGLTIKTHIAQLRRSLGDRVVSRHPLIFRFIQTVRCEGYSLDPSNVNRFTAV